MLDVLQQHLAETATPEVLACVEQAHQLFERIGLENYEQSFEELLMIDGSELAGERDTVTAICALTCSYLRQILLEHAVVCADHASMQFLVDLVGGLLDLQDYSDTGTLQAVCQLEGLPVELFGELMSLVTPHTAHEVMVYTEEVDRGLITRVQELANRVLTVDEQQENNLRTERHRLKLLALEAALGTVKLDFTQAVRQGLLLGLPFATYLQQFGAKLQNYTGVQAGQELLAMALASRDGVDNPRGVIEDQIEHYVSSMDSTTQALVAVGDLLLKINQQS